LHHQFTAGVWVCETENIKTNLSVTGCEDVQWNALGHDYISQR